MINTIKEPEKPETTLVILREIEKLIDNIARRLDIIEQKIIKIETETENLKNIIKSLEQTDAQKALNREKEIKAAIWRTIGSAIGGGLVFLALKLTATT